jgi:glc operon protein GlcG
MHQRFHLSHSDAMRIISAIQTQLDKEDKGAAVAVVDEHGELLAFLRTDGCRLSSINIAINKAYTAAREHKPSKEVGNSSRENQWPFTNFGELRYTGWGGGVPIFHAGEVIGGIGVSGLPESEDMVLAEIGANLF